MVVDYYTDWIWWKSGHQKDYSVRPILYVHFQCLSVKVLEIRLQSD